MGWQVDLHRGPGLLFAGNEDGTLMLSDDLFYIGDPKAGFPLFGDIKGFIDMV